MYSESLTELSDDHLVARYVGTGAERYFEELWRRYSREIFRRCLRVVRNPAVAEEVTAETFIKALRAVGGYQPGQFRGWLWTIGKRLCLTHVQSASTQREQAVGIEFERMADEQHTGSASPEDLALARQIQGLIGRLPPAQRIAVKLFYIDGYSYEEISAETGNPVHLVKSQIQNGIRKLRLLCRTSSQGNLP